VYTLVCGFTKVLQKTRLPYAIVCGMANHNSATRHGAAIVCCGTLKKVGYTTMGKNKKQDNTEKGNTVAAENADAVAQCPPQGYGEFHPQLKVLTNVIRRLIDHNPKGGKAPHFASRQRFACHVDGETVAEYIAAVQALPKHANPNYARADIPWEATRQYIAVFPQGHPLATADIAEVRAVCKPSKPYPADPMPA
jgi:hypothetical protein